MVEERILRLVCLEDGLLRIDFWSGEQFELDLSFLAVKGVLFAPLTESAFRAMAVLLDEGTHVEWPNGLDIGADTLYRMAKEARAPAGLKR